MYPRALLLKDQMTCPAACDIAGFSSFTAEQVEDLKDSSTNIDNFYYVEVSIAYYPMPGIYYGIAEDYFDFKANGIVDTHNSDAYELCRGNKLIIASISFMVKNSGTVVLLNNSSAVFDWKGISPNGGKYFRRTYLKK